MCVNTGWNESFAELGTGCGRTSSQDLVSRGSYIFIKFFRHLSSNSRYVWLTYRLKSEFSILWLLACSLSTADSLCILHHHYCVHFTLSSLLCTPYIVIIDVDTLHCHPYCVNFTSLLLCTFYIIIITVYTLHHHYCVHCTPSLMCTLYLIIITVYILHQPDHAHLMSS